MNFIFGLICMAVIVYLFLYFRPREKESLIVMALGCIMSMLHMTLPSSPTLFVNLVLTVLQIIMVLCCVAEFKDEYVRKKKRKTARTSVQRVSEKSNRVTA
ncbi:MAG: hypothetical protein ACI4M3_06880 [Acutalibacteraceae bacterium]